MYTTQQNFIPLARLKEWNMQGQLKQIKPYCFRGSNRLICSSYSQIVHYKINSKKHIVILLCKKVGNNSICSSELAEDGKKVRPSIT